MAGAAPNWLTPRISGHGLPQETLPGRLALEAAIHDDAAARRHAREARQSADGLGETIAAAEASWRRDEAAVDGFVGWLAGPRVLLGMLRRGDAERAAIAAARCEALGIAHLASGRLLRPLLRRRMLAGLLRRRRALREALLRQAFSPPLQQARTENFLRLRASGCRVAQDIALMLAPPRPELVEANGSDGIGAFLLAHGWGAGARAVPSFPGRYLRMCLDAMPDAEAAELVWVKRVMRGWSLPGNADAWLAAARRVLASPLFDAAFYRSEAGILADDLSAALHYVLVGDALAIRPSRGFDPGYYTERQNVGDRDGNRLLHYLDHGAREGTPPLPPAPFRANPQRMDATRDNVLLVVHEASRTGAPVLGWNIARHLSERHNVVTILLGEGPLVADFAGGRRRDPRAVPAGSHASGGFRARLAPGVRAAPVSVRDRQQLRIARPGAGLRVAGRSDVAAHARIRIHGLCAGCAARRVRCSERDRLPGTRGRGIRGGAAPASPEAAFAIPAARHVRTAGRGRCGTASQPQAS